MKNKESCPCCRLIVLHEVVDRLCRLFDMTQTELFEVVEGGKENMVRLMALSLCAEFSEMALSDIAEFFPGETSETVGKASIRLKKYLCFITGLDKKYQKLRKQVDRVRKEWLS